jgi:hypothetical protein
MIPTVGSSLSSHLLTFVGRIPVLTSVLSFFSKGLGVTRVLSRVTVACVSDSSPKSLAEPLVVSGPPFVIESTTDAPFLAKVTLNWNGQENAPTVVEHWVQVFRGNCVLWFPS